MAKQTAETDPLHVPRAATAHGDGDGSREKKGLSEWRSLDAYVLLGDPGSGKSWSFKAESAAAEGLLVNARDIVDDVAPQPVDDQIVFIDGLDEVRAGAGDGQSPFGAIRNWLHRMGRPRFRLSCREADWLGETDRNALARVAPSQAVEVLHLEPLSKDDVFAVLRDRSAEVPDPTAFWQRAEQLGLTELFGNPLLLDLTVKAGIDIGGNAPHTRQGIYEAACRQLAVETSIEHMAVKPPQPGDIDRLLNDAGLLCAVLLLSNKQSWALQAVGQRDTVDLPSLPESFPLRDARLALSSKVFTTVASRSTPRHRSIAEFLAAKALARRLDEGLPIGRVLALMQGFDGKPVEPLRGLFAWLVVHRPSDRARLMPLDPLGIVLNGDVAALSTTQRLDLLGALGEAARQDRWFRRDAWVSHPFGPLATADMAPTYETLLRDPDRSEAHQAFMDCVFDALLHGQSMPSLVGALEAWVEDGSAWIGNRLSAYEAWIHHINTEARPVKEVAWLQAIASGQMQDKDDRLTGALLTALYPEHLGPSKVLKFLRLESQRNSAVTYSMFWRQTLLNQSRPGDYAVLADAWIAFKSKTADNLRDYDGQWLSGKVLAAALRQSGDEASSERLYLWLGIGLDRHGFSKLKDEPRREVAQWLESRPERIREVVAFGFQSIHPDEKGQRFFWEAEQRLHGARPPRDWPEWLLEIAAKTTDEELSRYCFVQVALWVVDPPTSFDVPNMEEIECWVDSQAEARPIARQWLEESWTSSREDLRGDQYRRQLRYAAEQLQARDERKRAIQPHLANLATGNVPLDLLHQIALAHASLFSDINGETPIERVQSLLVSDEAIANAALASIDLVLAHQDLPSIDDVLKIEEKGQYHSIRPVALLAAQRTFEKSRESPKGWSDQLAQTLFAFYLTDGTGEMPGWYRFLVENRPTLVAPIFLRYAVSKIRKKRISLITGVWALGQESDHREFARLVLPTLLENFPLRASEANRRELNRSLLAALSALDDEQAASMVRLKLAQSGLDPMQRICWLVADLAYRAQAVTELAEWVGKNERRAALLGISLYEQGSLGRTSSRFSPLAVRHLIEILAPITPREIGSRAGIVSVANKREETVRGLLALLSSNTSSAARDELLELAESDHLGAWKDIVAYHLRTQQSAAREANFKAADPLSVASVLANLAPANAADLLALVTAHLSDIEAELRGANTFLLRQFWQGGKPHEENFCRDLVQSKLEQRLNPINVHIEREASAARDKRADMRATFMRSGERIAVPIEVKKENYGKLWTAWRTQLQQLYTNDPAAGGYGLYLVLWFGHSARASPEGVKATSARHLHDLIVDRIPHAERHQIEVQVLDLSLPV